MTDLIVRIPIEECSADVLGETLREMTFVGEGFGCYSNFDVRLDAVEREQWNARAQLGYIESEGNWLGAVPDEAFSAYEFRHYGLKIQVAWMWDGDGHLSFLVFDGNRFLRGVENTDCKKDYNWRDVQR